jgi:endonuclease/exonuclease/phosphatase family metal-dependent hydrolase
MRVAEYNQMFGLNGRSFLGEVMGTWIVHFQSNDNLIWNKANINKTVEIIKESDADIIGICEILEGQEEEIEKKLGTIGYKWVFFGEGHRTKFRRLHVKVAIASRIKGNKEYIHKEQIENKMGGGGGFVDCYFPSLKLNVMNVHLGLRSSLRNKQLHFLKNHLKGREKFVLMGDFNSSYDTIKNYFKNLKLVSDKIKTCSLTPIIHFLSWKDCDHIFVRGLKKRGTGFLEGRSDHRLIYADLE